MTNQTPKFPRFFLFVLILVALFATACGPAQEIAEAVVATPTMSVEQQVAATVAAMSTPTQQPASCELDKIGTWSEVASTSPYRIEVGGHGVQAVDFYPNKGVKTISYIVSSIAPSETPAIWFGYGSIWEGQLPACANFDFVADATNYASARLDSGHSGLVIDLRGGQFKVVANTANISQKGIDALLAQHMAAMDPTK